MQIILKDSGNRKVTIRFSQAKKRLRSDKGSSLLPFVEGVGSVLSLNDRGSIRHA